MRTSIIVFTLGCNVFLGILDIFGRGVGLEDNNDTVHAIVVGGCCTVSRSCCSWGCCQGMGSLGSGNFGADGKDRGREGVGFRISYWEGFADRDLVSSPSNNRENSSCFGLGARSFFFCSYRS